MLDRLRSNPWAMLAIGLIFGVLLAAALPHARASVDFNDSKDLVG